MQYTGYRLGLGGERKVLTTSVAIVISTLVVVEWLEAPDVPTLHTAVGGYISKRAYSN